MGFLTDIIRDSKKPVGHNTTEGAVRKTSAAAELPAGRNSPREPVAPLNDSLSPFEEPSKTFWEEEVGQSGAARAEAQPSEFEDRQVVGPSLSENTEDSDLAKAPEYIRSSPDHGKQKQTGLKNRSDVTVQRMNRDLTLHGVVSFDKEKFSSEDPSVVKPVSKHLEQSAREKSVDVTHRSRQAGQTTRAGATTPPNPINRARPAPKSEEKPPAPEDGQVSPSSIATPPETVVPKTDASRAGWLESTEERGEALTSPAKNEDGKFPVPPDLSAAEKIGEPSQRTVEPSVPKKETMAADYDDIPVQNPIEVFFPDEQAPEPLQAEPREEATSQAGTRKPVHEPGGSKVHIGLLEVVVLAPENAPGRKASKSPEGHNIASRHYLRNL